MLDAAFYGTVAASAVMALVQCWKIIIQTGSDWGAAGSGMACFGLAGLFAELRNRRHTQQNLGGIG